MSLKLNMIEDEDFYTKRFGDVLQKEHSLCPKKISLLKFCWRKVS